MSYSIRMAYEAGRKGTPLLSVILNGCRKEDKTQITKAYAKGVMDSKKEKSNANH